MAWVRRVKSGRFQGQYRDANKKVRSAGGTYEGKKEALHAAQELERQVRRGEWTDPKIACRIFADFADEVMAARLHLEASSRGRDESYRRNHIDPAFGHLPLNQITKPAVQKWVKELHEDKGKAPSTVKDIKGILSRIMAEAVEEHLIPENPCRKVSLPRNVRKEKKYLTGQQVPLVVKAMNERRAELLETEGIRTPNLSAAVFVAAYGSLRWGEVFGLKRENLDIPKRELRVVGSLKREEKGRVRYSEGLKSTSRRGVIVIPDLLAAILARHLLEAPESEFVFSQLNGGHVNPSNFRQRHWLPALERAGVGHVRFHSLKDTSYMLLRDLKADDLQMQERMGHRDISTTLRHYGHVSPERDERLTSRMNELFAAYMLHAGTEDDLDSKRIVPLTREFGSREGGI